VKKGILPNTQMGRALKVDQSRTRLARSEWLDGNGPPAICSRRIGRGLSILEDRAGNQIGRGLEVDVTLCA
jgi:hypothetical protein